MLKRQRNVIFAATLICMLNAGTIYLFSTYITSLATHLSLTPVQTNLIASCGGFGLYLSAPSTGYLVERKGAQLVVRLGGVSLLIGYGGLAASYAGRWWWGVVALFYSLVGLGSSAVFNGCLSTNVRNYASREHGYAVGVSVAGFGLSAFFFTQMSGFFQVVGGDGEGRSLDALRFLIFMACCTGGVTLVSSLFIRDISAMMREVDAAAGLEAGGGGATAAAAAEDEDEGTLTRRDERRGLLRGGALSNSTVIDEEDVPPNAAVVARNEFNIFSSTEAWLLFFALALSTGPGLMVINNIGKIVLKLGGDGSSQRLHVSLLSLFNCGGRIVAGLWSDYAMKHYGTSRIKGAMLGVGALGLAQIFYGFVVDDLLSLAATTSVLGLGYGAIFSSMPALVSKFFGVRRFSSNWGWYQFGPALGGMVFNTFVFGIVLSENEGRDCLGASCYEQAFWVSTFSATCALVMLWVVDRRTSKPSS